MTDAAVGDAELSRAVLREALRALGTEERALLRVALARGAGDIDEDNEHMLRLLTRFDTRGTSTMRPEERWALASALRRLRGVPWAASHEAANVHGSDEPSEEPSHEAT
ncbi:MAG: hypothetical protein U1E73_01830 [Planctomycetota bacterium]